LLLLTTQMTKTKSNINQQSLIKGSNVKRVFLYLSRKKSNQIKTLFFSQKTSVFFERDFRSNCIFFCTRYT
jgi:hypothetical protein